MPLGLAAAKRLSSAAATAGAVSELHEHLGGTRKRRRRVDELPADPFTTGLLEDIAIGRERPATASSKARRLQTVGMAPPGCTEMASFRLTDSGCIDERDWHAWTRNLYGLELCPYYLRVKLHTDQGDVPSLLPVLLPHEIYHAMHLKSESLFLQSVLGDTPISDVGRFWERSITQPWASRHPAYQRPELLDRTIRYECGTMGSSLSQIKSAIYL